MQIEDPEWLKWFKNGEAKYDTGTVFAYRDVMGDVFNGERQALEGALKVLDKRIGVNRDALSKAQMEQRAQIEKLESEVHSLRAEARSKKNSYTKDMGILSYLIGFCSLLATVIGGAIVIGGSSHDFAEVLPIFVIGLVVSAFIFRHPFIEFFTATIPANELKAQIPAKQNAVERQKVEGAAQLTQESNRLDRELEELKSWRQACDSALQNRVRTQPLLQNHAIQT